MFLSVIIPAYNEEERLPATLEKVRAYLMKQDYDFEVLIVDDGSTDKTEETVRKYICNWPDFKVISYKPNRGKGYAVKKGMLEAKGDWRLLMDADGSTAIEEVEKLLPYINQKSNIKDQNENLNIKNYNIIIGSRYLNKDSIKVKQPLGRRIMSRAGNILVRNVLGVKSVDTQCGFKLFSGEATEKIFPLQTIDRWGFDMEILAIAIRKGYKIKEVAVDWYDAEGSQVKKGTAVKTLKELWQIKRNIIRGKYQIQND